MLLTLPTSTHPLTCGNDLPEFAVAQLLCGSSQALHVVPVPDVGAEAAARAAGPAGSVLDELDGGLGGALSRAEQGKVGIDVKGGAGG